MSQHIGKTFKIIFDSENPDECYNQITYKFLVLRINVHL